MKKYINIIAVCSLLIGFYGCEEENEDPIFVVQEVAMPRIVTTNETVPLSRETADQKAFTIVWENAQYSIATPITYTVEAALAGTGFEVVEQVGTTTDQFYTLTVADLNNLAISLGLETDVEGSLEFRITSAIGTTGSSNLTSDFVIATVTPYPAILPVRYLFLVGAATDSNKDGVANGDDWNNNANNTFLFKDAENDDLYYFQGFFAAQEFKLLENKGFWQPQWGLDNGNLTSSEILGNDPGSFIVNTTGFYNLVVNTEELTYTLEILPEAENATTYSAMGIMGSARTGDDSGWDAGANPDTNLTQSPFNPHIWYLDKIDVFDGELKIRADDDWTNSWGANTGLNGQGNNNNDPNITITQGSYSVWFNDLDGRFTFIPITE